MKSSAATVDAITARVRSFLSSVEVQRYDARGATAMVVAFAALGRVAHAGETMFARRAEETNAWQSSGASSAASHLAGLTGESAEEMRRKLAAAKRLENLPNASEAFRNGDLSRERAEALARAGAAAPEREGELLKAAQSSSFDEAKEKLRRAATNASLEAREARMRAARKLRSANFWVDRDNDAIYHGYITGPIADLGRVKARLEPLSKGHFRAARKSGQHGTQRQYDYDAFMDLITEPAHDAGGSSEPVVEEPTLFGDAESASKMPPLVDPEAADEFARVKSGKPPCKYGGHRGNVIVNVDATPLIRGYTIGDEVCANPLCRNTLGLQLDHRRPVSDLGPGVLPNLAMLCGPCHKLKTHYGWCLVALGATGCL